MTACRVIGIRLQTPITQGPFHEWALPDGTRWASFYRNDTGYVVRFWDLADFQVSADGHAISCFPTTTASAQTIEHLYLNQVLPLALGRQRKLMFHASAAEVDGVAVAFFGPTGRGKSTLVASFAANGSPFLADDGLLLLECEGRLEVEPSQPFVRLWEDSQEALIGGRTAFPRAAQYTAKVRVPSGDAIAFCPEARPLSLAFFLGEGDVSDVLLLPMSPNEALIELVKHSFLLDIEDKEVLAWHFGRLARLANQPIWHRLDYPRRFEALPEVRDAVLHQLSQSAIGP